MEYIVNVPRRPASGLCNQLLNICLCVETASRTKRIAVLGGFLPNFNSDAKVGVDRILDLEATQKEFKMTNNLIVNFGTTDAGSIRAGQRFFKKGSIDHWISSHRVIMLFLWAI